MSWWARGSRPIWLVVMFWFLLNLGAPAVYRWWNPDNTFSEVVEGGFFGVLAGQVCFAALAGGLRWRPWGLGYAIGIVITTVGLLGLVIGFALVDDHDNEAFLYLAILPPVLLSLTAPLFVFRFAFGWNLVAKHEATPTRESVRIEDLFHVTAVTAAMLVLLRIPPVTLNDSQGYWPMMIVFCGIAFAIGLLVLPICVWLALGTTRRLTAIAGLMLLAIIVPACIFAITQAAMPRETRWEARMEVLKNILAASGGASCSLVASLFVQSRCGMSLVRAGRNDSADSDLARPQQTSTRWLTAAAVAVAIIVSICLNYVVQQRKAAAAELVRLEALAESFDGKIAFDDRKIMAIQLGERATDSDLNQFRAYSDIASIDLSHSSVTDRGLATLTHFPKTTELKLNGTQVTAAGLGILDDLHYLEWLELNDTQVAGSAFSTVHPSPALTLLELDNSSFDDDGCQELWRFSNLAHLSLAGTRVTDAGLQHLLGLTKLKVLIASHTAVTGDGLSQLPQLVVLSLDETLVNDSSISNLIQLPSLYTLDLSGTAITDVALERLRALPSLRHLTLSDTAVTGDGFRDWNNQGQLVTLKLSLTALDDVSVKHLRQFSPLGLLDVSGTQISDACLPYLAEMRINELYLGNTQITAAGLLAAGMVNQPVLLVSPEQFTESELQQLKTQFAITEVVGPSDKSSEK